MIKLGFEVAQSSVAKYMVKRRGPPSQGWRTFLHNHAPDIAAMDLFVVPTIGFDLSQAIAGAMKEGMIKVAVDQQPFIQGYGAVGVLTNYARFGVLQANDVYSGPGLITKDNLDQVLAQAGKYR